MIAFFARLFIAGMCLGLSSGQVLADIDPDAQANPVSLEVVAAHLSDHVIGRPLVTSLKVGRMDAGRLEYEFARTMIFSDLKRSANGLTFAIGWHVNQTNYQIVDEQRQLPGKNQDRMGTTQCEIRQARSVANRLMGFCHVVSNSLTDATGAAQAVDVGLNAEGHLTLTMRTVNFADHFAATASGYKPASSVDVMNFRLADGKLELTQLQTSWDLDPETLERLPGTEAVSELVSREP